MQRKEAPECRCRAVEKLERYSSCRVLSPKEQVVLTPCRGPQPSTTETGGGVCVTPSRGNQSGIILPGRLTVHPPRVEHSYMLQHQPGEFVVWTPAAGKAMLLYSSLAAGSAGYTQQ